MTRASQIGPSPRVYGVALQDRHVLLVRAANPQDGEEIWWLPGGGIDWGESPTATLRRELHEETGLELAQHHLFSVTDDQRTRTNGEHVHTVRIVYLVSVLKGELRHEADGSTDHVKWVSIDELTKYQLADYAAVAVREALLALAPVSVLASDPLEAFRRVASL